MTSDSALEALGTRIESLVPDAAFPDDPFIILALRQALAGAREGNGAIGAVLADGQGRVIFEGRNRMFCPHFRSDLHAEMDVLTGFEESHKNESLRGCTLFTTLEPCEMCTIRIIYSGVSRVRFAAPDFDKGGISGPNKLPQLWTSLASDQEFAAAECRPELADLSRQIFDLTLPRALAKLQQRRTGASSS